jgi:hypothetical protein
MTVDARSLWVVIGVAVAISIGIYFWVDSGSTFAVCVPALGEATKQRAEAMRA